MSRRPVLPPIDLDLPTPPPDPATWDEYLAWAARKDVRAEWVDGTIEVLPPMSYEHQSLGYWLSRVLSEYIDPRGLGEIIPPLPMRLPSRRRGRSPDVIFLAAERRRRLRRTYIDGPADLVVEIISPDSVERDTVTKRAEYAAGGVREYWVIDPDARQATFYQLQPDGLYQPGPIDADGVYRSVVIPGFWLRVDWLWQRPLPPIAQIRHDLGLA